MFHSDRVVMDYGGSDLSRTFHWLLKGIGFPYKECDLANRIDALFIQELKETYCHLDQVIELSEYATTF